jgi:hypothetical protein
MSSQVGAAATDASVRILEVKLLSDDWYVLKKTTRPKKRPAFACVRRASFSRPT